MNERLRVELERTDDGSVFANLYGRFTQMELEDIIIEMERKSARNK